MPLKKIDNRIRALIENCVATSHRSFFVVVGSKARDQVVILYHMLTKATITSRPNVLWCYKKELGFSTHRKKRMRKLKKKMQNKTLDVNEDDPFEFFIGTTNIRYCYYSETHKILGQTFGVAVIQDFEAMTPNLLARTVETVDGGGMVILLLQTLTSLKQLYTMSMDVHARYRTEAHQDVVCRFNERFLLSLSSCANCLVLDDKLNILPISSNALNIKPVPRKSLDDPKSPSEKELAELKESHRDMQPVGVLIDMCKTLDQAKAVLKFVDVLLYEKDLCTTVALTSARGRGKSAALGIAIACAIAFGYNNIFVTSPSPENLKSLFAFLVKGLDVLGYEDNLDYDITQSKNPEFNKAVVKVNISRGNMQVVQYIHPADANKLVQGHLLVIDEAAAIPLHFVKSLLGSCVVFMSTTINGYEGTGRSLSLKLINQLRQQAASIANEAQGLPEQSTVSSAGTSRARRSLHEITLHESIRYQSGDAVEAWLNQLLCLDATVTSHLHSRCPEPKDCELYYVCRDTLFSHHKVSEAFLQRLVALFVASHYKNSPNDLLMMSDAPAHHVFCLLAPVDDVNTKKLPEVLCVIQICFEGSLSKDFVKQELARGRRSAGDMIPWIISQYYNLENFSSLSGARIVRIATHPDYQRMGYGLRALQLLQEYFEGKIPVVKEILDHMPHKDADEAEEEFTGLLEEKLVPRKSLPPLLLKLNERRPEKLDYLGVSYGLTEDLLRFWKKAGFVPTYVAQTSNDLTGDHSCIMLKALESEFVLSEWLPHLFGSFKMDFLLLLHYSFHRFQPTVALGLVTNVNIHQIVTEVLNKDHLESYEEDHILSAIERCCQTHAYDEIDVSPIISDLSTDYFLDHLSNIHLTYDQKAILICHMQGKSFDQTAKELQLTSSEVMGLFTKAIRRLASRLRQMIKASNHEIDSQEESFLQEDEIVNQTNCGEHSETKKPQGTSVSDCSTEESEDKQQNSSDSNQQSFASKQGKRFPKSEASNELPLKRSKQSHKEKLNLKRKKN